jgi:trehalose synthase
VPLGERPATADLWWLDASIYCLDVETFADGNGDGIGDFAGLTERLDHLASLGVTCLWLLPFHPTTNRDDGYDVTDYYNVDPRLGTLGDFVIFVRAAAERGLHVLVDLVVNHTSDEHPWFVDARSSRDAAHHDWYVWSPEPVEEAEGEMFPGEQGGNWTYVEAVDRWYFHRFHEFQPELDQTNPAVRDELYRVLGYWLQLGVDGFRIDAAPYLVQSVGPNGPPGERDHELLRELRTFVSRRKGSAVLLGEANLPPEEAFGYFGSEDGPELHLLFDFEQSGRLGLALARRDAEPMREYLRALPQCREANAWVNFVRLHDELTLERLEPDEREEVRLALAPEEPLLWDRGLRRRLAPMLDGDVDRTECTLALLLSLPGVPALLYGDELGMGDRLDLPGRLPVRTLMQWTAGPTAGFSTAAPADLVRPFVTDGPFAADRVNVAAESADPGSLLERVRRLLRVRRTVSELSVGAPEVLEPSTGPVLVHCVRWEGWTFVAAHNLGTDPVTIAAPPDWCTTLVAVRAQPDGEEVRLEGDGFAWFRGRR